ncbi:MAG: multidrug ABC transporter permease, partial [Pyrobaculum sp.]
LPYISYLLEAYIKTRNVRYGGIVAGGVTFFFFYFLFPKLLMPYNVAEVLWSTAMFLVAVFITVAITQAVRLMLKTR